LHEPFPLPRGLVGVFCTIVEVAVLSMFHPKQNLPLRCTIALQFIGDDHAWDTLAAFEELAEELLGGDLIAPTLHQDMEHVPVLVDGAPKIVPFTVDREEYFAQVPCAV
jgi:hypothetical protein